MPPPRQAAWVARHRGLLIGLGVALAVAAGYAPVVDYGFVNYDDPEYVLDNVPVQQGLSRAGLVWAFTTFHSANWHPLTWVSHMLDCQLFGLAAGGHHATSVLLHAASALILFAALGRMTGAVWRSGMVAALFALHPLRVESVAWISERKDVLGTFWWMVALLVYAYYVERPTWRRYAALALAFAAGLLAKPMVVTLPFALLLLDLWPLRRLPLGPGAWRRGVHLVLEKVPLLALAAGASVVTFHAQQVGGAVTSFAAHPLSARVANALLSYVAYLRLTLWPTGLAAFYPYREAFPLWQLAGAALGLVSLTVLFASQVGRRPWLLVGWLWYLGTLVPVIGIIRAGDQAMADRFTYLPHVGLFVMLVWGLAEVGRSWRLHRLVLPAAATVALTGCLVGTRFQVRYWRDSSSLFAHALATTERNALAHTNYGFALLERGQAQEALEHFRRAVTIKPYYAKANMNLGFGLSALGRADEALAAYREAVRLDPGYAAAHYNLGLELAEQGRLDEAIAQYRDAVRVDPTYAKAHNNLGLALVRTDRTEEALEHYQAALALDPRLAAAHNNLAVLLERLGRADEALEHYREAVRLAPADARAHFNLGAVLAGRQRPADAAAEFRETLRLRADLVETRIALGDVFAKQGHAAQALAEYRAALAARPEWALAEARVAEGLAMAAAADGDRAEAIRLAESARDRTAGNDPEVLRGLAAAYAAVGWLHDAAAVARHAAELARAAGLGSLAAEIEGRLAAYEAAPPRQ